MGLVAVGVLGPVALPAVALDIVGREGLRCLVSGSTKVSKYHELEQADGAKVSLLNSKIDGRPRESGELCSGESNVP